MAIEDCVMCGHELLLKCLLHKTDNSPLSPPPVFYVASKALGLNYIINMMVELYKEKQCQRTTTMPGLLFSQAKSTCPVK